MKYPPLLPKVPHLLHGGDYNPDQWRDMADTIWKEDMRLAKLAGLNSLTVGIFAWSALEPQEGQYDFTWLDTVMDNLAQNGLYAVLATPSGARPAWMSQKYPEVLRVTPERVRRLHGTRHNHCLTSPVYRNKVTQINTLLATRYKNHPALAAWHISNEYGGECHCPLCQQRFRDWLQKRYGTLDALNHAWWTAFWSHTYTDWSQIESPSPLGETSVHGQNLDWKRFTTEQFVDFYQMEAEPLQRITPDIPCTTNLMGTYPGVNYFRLAEKMDFVSWDAYPQWTGRLEEDEDVAVEFAFKHDLTRGLKDGQPFFLMESSPSATNWRPYARLHRPGVHQLQSLQAVAHGADSVQYFQFRKSRGSSEKMHGAVVDHAGHEGTRVFADVAQVGSALAKLDGVVGTTAPARVALLYDWENRWALEDMAGLNNRDKKYEAVVLDHYRALWRSGVAVDIVDSSRDFSGHDILIAPMLYMLRGDVAQRIREFVAQGGVYVATFATGYVDAHDLCFLGGFPGPLMEVMGVWCEEIDVLLPGEQNAITWQGRRYTLGDYAELVHLKGAQALASYESDFYAGRPALTVNRVGKGAAYMVAGRMEDAFLYDFYRKLCAEKGVPVHELPQGVSRQVRTDGEREYVFLLNFAPTPCTLREEGQDLLTGETVNEVTLQGHGSTVLLRGPRP